MLYPCFRPSVPKSSSPLSFTPAPLRPKAPQRHREELDDFFSVPVVATEIPELLNGEKTKNTLKIR
jgi:hypothetical protein